MNIEQEQQQKFLTDGFVECKEMEKGNIKFYKNEEGKVQAWVPLSELSKETDGGPVTIDNTLTESAENGGCYRNVKGSFNARFAKTLEGGELLSVEKGRYKVSLTPSEHGGSENAAKRIRRQTAARVVRREQANFGLRPEIRPETQQSVQSGQILGTPEIRLATGSVRPDLESEIIYENAMPDTDLQYIVTPVKVKENIVVHRPQAGYAYNFTLKTENVQAALTEDGKTVAFTAADTGKEVFTIPAPVMSDASGAVSGDVSYTLTAVAENESRLTVTASAEWINDPQRAFPVTIDPSISISATNMLYWGETRVGFYYNYDKGYYEEINASCSLSYQYLVQSVLGVTYADISSCAVILPFLSGALQNPIAYCNGQATLEPYVIRQGTKVDGMIFGMPTGFASDTATFEINARNDFPYTGTFSSNTNNAGLLIAYTPKTSRPEGEYGENPKVNLGTGRLMYMEQGVSADVNSYAVGAAPVYCSDMDVTYPGMSTGWKLDAHQTIAADNGDYLYSDAAGYQHKLYACGGGMYVSGDGAYRLSSSVITDRQGNKLSFNAGGRLSMFESYQHPGIRKVYVHNASNQLTKIYDQRVGNETTATTYVEIAYSGDRISTMTAKQNNAEIHKLAFGYQGDQLTALSQSLGGSAQPKPIRKYTYVSGKLESVQDIETKTGFKTGYAAEKVTRLSGGTFNGSDVFTEKTFNTFQYTAGVGLSCAVTAGNEKNVTSVYHLNSEGRLTDAFTKVGNNLATPSKDAGVYVDVKGGTTVANVTVNHHPVKSATGTLNFSLTGNINVALSDNERGLQKFALKCRMMHFNSGERLRAVLTYSVDGSSRSSTVEIDGNATEVWQHVSFPVELPAPSGATVYTDKVRPISLKVEKASNGAGVTMRVANCYIAPSYKTRMFLQSGSVTLDVDQIETVTLQPSQQTFNNKTSNSMYFTAGDLLRNCQAYALRYPYNGSQYFDAVGNDGKKSLGAVTGITLSGAGKTLTVQSSNFCVENVIVTGKAESKKTYTFSPNEIFEYTTTRMPDESGIVRQIIDSVWRKRSGDVTMEYNDATGIQTDYTYTAYGDLTKTETYNTLDPLNRITEEIRFDADGRHMTGAVDERSHYNGQEIKTTCAYNSWGFPSAITYPNGQTETYGYNGVNLALASVTAAGNTNGLAYDAATDRLSALSHNSFSYGFGYDERGNLSAVSVGGNNLLTKLYAQHNPPTQYGEAETETVSYANGASVKSGYDAYGRLAKEHADGTRKVDYVYG